MTAGVSMSAQRSRTEQGLRSWESLDEGPFTELMNDLGLPGAVELASAP
ncbi:hypothetical protein [Streptomyces violaceoruber]|nr:hypothetical protein [Streptomyces violaceoruber]